jgi:hypothetical protein
MDSAEKTKYRQSARWKKLRDAKVAATKRCEFCGYPLRGRSHLHHSDDSDYETEDASKLKLLHSSCHKFVGYFEKRDPADCEPLLRQQLARVIKRYADYVEQHA